MGWFEDWYAAKNVRKVHTSALITYLNDLTFFGEGPAKLSTEQVIRRLSTLSTQTKSAERYRRLCVVIKEVVKRLRGRDEADKMC